MTELIRIKGVTKEYKKDRVLENANLIIEEGDVIGVIGQSGSGKTTLLSLIAGFIEPTDGEVVYVSKVDNVEHNLHENLHKIKKHIGFTQQRNSFYGKLTVMENLVHFGKLCGLPTKTVLANARNLLEFTHLTNHHDKLAEHLSGGMQKRLDISCSLVHKPKILLLDEPTADLDPILRRDILNLLQEVNQQGVTVVIASHHLDEVESICNKVAVVHQGKVHSFGLIEDVRKPYLRDNFTINIQPGTDKERLLNHLNKLPITKIIDHNGNLQIYTEKLEQTMSSLIGFIKDEHLNFHDLNIQKPSLRDVFEQIAGNN